MRTESKGTFLQGAFVLTISTALVKIAGLLFTFPLAKMLGDLGMGYFYGAYEIYNLLAVLASAGLPVAVSRMISEALEKGKPDEADRIYKVSATMFSIIGALIAGVMFIFAGPIAETMGNSGAALSIRVLSITAFLSFIMSPLRGYFQGHSIMTPTAVSQVIEAVCKLVFGFSLAYVLTKTELSLVGGSAGAMLGVTIGAGLAVLYLWWRMKRVQRSRENGSAELPKDLRPRSTVSIIKELFRIAIPVSLGASVMTIVNVIDSWAINNILQDGLGIPLPEFFGGSDLLDRIFRTGLGYTEDAAVSLYGLFGNAKKIFNLPSAFIVPFTVSILPVLTAAVTAKDDEKIVTNMTNCFKYAFMISVPAGIGMMVLAEPIMTILYSPSAVGSAMLAVFGAAVILYSVVSITNAILQAFGKVNFPLISLCVGAVVKVVLNALLLAIPSVNILGAPIATCACYVVMIVMNFIFIGKYMTNLRVIGLNTLKALISSLVMGGAAYGLYALLSDALGVKLGGLIAIAGAGVVYVVMLFVVRAVTAAELKSLLKRG